MDTNVVLFPRQSERLGKVNRPGIQAADRFKLFAADKIELFRWEADGAAATMVRIVVHEGSGLCEEDSDVALLYTPGGLWARWGLARHGNIILVWRCTDGQDLGRFSSLREALEAVALCGPSGVASSRAERATACSA